MKRVANTHEEPVVIPLVVVLIHVHLALVIPTVENRVALMCETPSVSPFFDDSK